MTDRRISASPRSQSTASTNTAGTGSGSSSYTKIPVLTSAPGHPPRPPNVLGSTLRVNQMAPVPKMNKHNIEFTATDANDSDGASNGIMDQLLARLSEQSARLREHEPDSGEITTSDDDTYVQIQNFTRATDHSSSSNSVPITPATDAFPMSMPSTRPASASFQDRDANEEVSRLRLQLAQAHNKLASVKNGDIGRPRDHNNLENEIITQNRIPMIGRNNSLVGFDDTHHPDASDVILGGRTHRGIPFHPARPAYTIPSPQMSMMGGDAVTGSFPPTRGVGHNQLEPMMPYGPSESFGSYRADHIATDYNATPRNAGGRRCNRFPAAQQQQFGPASYGSFSAPNSAAFYDNSINSIVPMNGGVAMSPTPSAMSVGLYGGFTQQPMTSPLSPHATEFASSDGSWRGEAIATEGQTYLPTTEPLNYRRLLDRSVNCNWKYIVDKIVCNNDQQASIFLQQKLKVSTPEQKYEIVEAIVSQAYPLMVNRFGNFLIQRCFEHGTPEQVIKIAEAIRGNTLNLAMDPFGCHVVQKAFDSVPEDYKAIMVHELLRRIPETVIHRYACHVWQKLFELRWQETPPQIMKYVNEALRGMWHEVALGETGSLVVQNIFENCLEEDKRPCVEEVLANIDIVAHGQFGNWCIQHICEHGAPADRSRAIDHVIRYASEYSSDQFASKVVEKCLKIGGPEFLGRYLDRVCEGRPDRPRIPLIDIASDQYGNYLVQYILTHSNPQHREIVMAHIRKHMVSLRGSKFGSRVGMLCTNPAVTTRPGPGAGPNMSGPRMGRFGGMYR